MAHRRLVEWPDGSYTDESDLAVDWRHYLLGLIVVIGFVVLIALPGA